MDSAHRHQLQTNTLAQRLDSGINKLRPYTSTILGAIIALAIGALVWSYMSNQRAAQQAEAWTSYNDAVGTLPPNLERLNRAAQEYPNTPMQNMAELTWADGQLYTASQSFIGNRSAATDALNRATSGYQNVLQRTRDKSLIDRAHLGLARVYEMRGQLEKAREEYGKIAGGYKEYAEAQIKRLEEPEAAETYAWLEKAQPPRMTAPAGPGIPGQRPIFSAGDLSLPVGEEDDIPANAEPATSFDDLLKGLGSSLEAPGQPVNNSALPGEVTPITEPPAFTEAPAEEATEAEPADESATSETPPTAEQPAEESSAP